MSGRENLCSAPPRLSLPPFAARCLPPSPLPRSCPFGGLPPSSSSGPWLCVRWGPQCQALPRGAHSLNKEEKLRYSETKGLSDRSALLIPALDPQAFCPQARFLPHLPVSLLLSCSRPQAQVPCSRPGISPSRVPPAQANGSWELGTRVHFLGTAVTGNPAPHMGIHSESRAPSKGHRLWVRRLAAKLTQAENRSQPPSPIDPYSLPLALSRAERGSGELSVPPGYKQAGGSMHSPPPAELCPEPDNCPISPSQHCPLARPSREAASRSPAQLRETPSGAGGQGGLSGSGPACDSACWGLGTSLFDPSRTGAASTSQPLSHAESLG